MTKSCPEQAGQSSLRSKRLRHGADSKLGQRFGAPKTWLGSEGVNVLQVRYDLLDLGQQMNTQLATHTHLPGPTPASTDAGIHCESGNG